MGSGSANKKGFRTTLLLIASIFYCFIATVTVIVAGKPTEGESHQVLTSSPSWFGRSCTHRVSHKLWLTIQINKVVNVSPGRAMNRLKAKTKEAPSSFDSTDHLIKKNHRFIFPLKKKKQHRSRSPSLPVRWQLLSTPRQFEQMNKWISSLIPVKRFVHPLLKWFTTLYPLHPSLSGRSRRRRCWSLPL